MRFMRKDRNPLAYAFWAALIMLPLWVVYWREGYGIVGIAAIMANIGFIVLYLRRVRLAWHLALLLNLGFALYRLVEGHHLRADIIIYTILVVYLFVVRQAYFDYISVVTPHERI